jgi:trans-aconitate methyltransferase
MNLPDLLNRKDRAWDVRSGGVTVVDHRDQTGRHRALRLNIGARVALRGADEFSFLKTFPRYPHWTVLGGGGVRVSLSPAGEDGGGYLLAEAPAVQASGTHNLVLEWPLSAADGPFDLWLEQVGDEPTILSVGRLSDSRAKVKGLLSGRGVEVGPGMRPLVLPAPGVDVEYLEEKSPQEWQDVYGKGQARVDALTPDVLDRYRIGSASSLDTWPPGSLDFIFSNHVFEHLMNPKQVLTNWLERLKPGGAIVGIIPDARFTFDLRQPFSRLEEFKYEQEHGGFAVTDDKYAKWCRYTAPYNTINDLKSRKYSVHVHYYTPEVFLGLIDLLRSEGLCGRIFIDNMPNNKDFGFALRKPGGHKLSETSQMV